jgi:hypothetical protein
MVAMLFAGASSAASGQSSSSGRIGPSGGEVAGAAIGVGAAVAIVITVFVSRSHHTLTGCATTGASGLALQTNDGKTYKLEGNDASIKAGDKVKVHGSKMKKTRDSTGPQVFTIDKLNRDYGPCQVVPANSPPSH